MSETTFLHDNTHVLISGITGSGEDYGGKTATANWWLTEAVSSGHFDYAISFDVKGGNYRGVRVRNPKEAAKAVSQGRDKLNWVPDRRGDLSEQHDDMMAFSEGLAGDVIIAHDDAVMYASAESLKWALALGGNPSAGGAIKSLVVSQDPWDLPRKAVRANTPVTVWVGPFSEEAERYFKSMGMVRAAKVIRERHTKPHMWSVVDGNTVITFDPVPEGYA